MPLDRVVIRRFHHVLVEEVRRQSPEYLAQPFTVAEIYQSLVPYRTHRDAIGIELNGDYEAALLQLLSGEGEFLELESEAARARIQRELKSGNPNTGIYREFAAVQVRLNPDRLPEPGSEPAGTVLPRDGAGSGGGKGADGSAESSDSGKATAGSGKSSDSGGSDGNRQGSSAALVKSAAGAGTGSAQPTRGSSGEKRSGRSGEGAPSRPRGAPPKECPDCESDLPDRETLRFCPFCGTNVFIMPCGECGEVLERDWMYCLACGSPTDS